MRIVLRLGKTAAHMGSLLALSFLLHAQVQAAPDMAKRPPNVALIVLDDMGMSDMAPYGSEITTPNLGTLADGGTVFTNFHTHAACSPTRSMLMTGVDNHRIGLGTMEGSVGKNQEGKPGYTTVVNLDALMVPQLLKDNGYHTYMAGKWHLGHDAGYWPADRGFEESYVLIPGGASHYSDATEYASRYQKATYAINRQVIKKLPNDFYSTKQFTDAAIGFIDKNKADKKPFFLYLAYTAPHSPLHVPDDALVSKYEKMYAKGWDAVRADRLKRMQEKGIVPAHVRLSSRWEKVKAWDSLTPEEQKYETKKMAIYAAMIEYLDTSIGRFVQHLKNIGEYDNTLFIVMTDNGADGHNNSEGKFKKWITEQKIKNTYETIGKPGSFVSIPEGWAQVSTTPFLGAKGAVSEGGIHGAFFVHYPAAVPAGKRAGALTSVVDVTPTLLDFAGIKHPGNSYQGKSVIPMDGRSMRSLWEGKSDRVYGPDEPVLFELYGKVNKALYLGDWKVLRLGDHPWGHGESAQWQLFNLQMDPAESVDLSAAYPELKEKMIKLYAEREQAVGFVPAELPKTP